MEKKSCNRNVRFLRTFVSCIIRAKCKIKDFDFENFSSPRYRKSEVQCKWNSNFLNTYEKVFQRENGPVFEENMIFLKIGKRG